MTSGSPSDVEPTWSPDGSRLAFTRIGFGRQHVDVGHIFVINVDGSGLTQLTKGPKPDTYPAWSPDGTEIAFTRGGVNRPENSNVFVMDADGRHERKLTNSRGFDGLPSWSADGAKIAFTSDRDGNPELYTMNADGSGQIRLTGNPASDAHPAWSPDGTRIAFISERDEAPQLYVMSACGGGEQRLTSGRDEPNIPAGEYAPTWSPDGATIAYSADQDITFGIALIGAGGGPIRPLSAPGFAPSWERPAGTAAGTATFGARMPRSRQRDSTAFAGWASASGPGAPLRAGVGRSVELSHASAQRARDRGHHGQVATGAQDGRQATMRNVALFKWLFALVVVAMLGCALSAPGAAAGRFDCRGRRGCWLRRLAGN